ncbi:hypothetical protein DP117_02405 [Brasilonema sp. UFV-L1]|nr:hypothetical protein [Brasilonema sp. UFV-L1]
MYTAQGKVNNILLFVKDSTAMLLSVFTQGCLLPFTHKIKHVFPLIFFSQQIFEKFLFEEKIKTFLIF